MARYEQFGLLTSFGSLRAAGLHKSFGSLRAVGLLTSNGLLSGRGLLARLVHHVRVAAPPKRSLGTRATVDFQIATSQRVPVIPRLAALIRASRNPRLAIVSRTACTFRLAIVSRIASVFRLARSRQVTVGIRLARPRGLLCPSRLAIGSWIASMLRLARTARATQLVRLAFEFQASRSSRLFCVLSEHCGHSGFFGLYRFALVSWTSAFFRRTVIIQVSSISRFAFAYRVFQFVQLALSRWVS